MFIASEEVVRLILRSGVEAMATNDEGMDAVMHACMGGGVERTHCIHVFLDFVKNRLNKKWDINRKDRSGKTALHWFVPAAAAILRHACASD